MTNAKQKLMLMDICPSCDLKYMCDNMPPHPNDNEVWHSCPIKNERVSRLFAEME